MSPHTQGHPGTRHTVITVEREKEKKEENKTKQSGGMEGRQKVPLKKGQLLRESKGCTTLFPTWLQIVGTLRPPDLSTYA